MDIRLDDGTIIRNVPNGVTKEQVQAKLDAKRARDSGTTGADYLKALASGVNRIGASIAGGIDNSIVGDVARIASGMPTKADALLENPAGGPWSKELRDAMLARMTPERRAKAELAAAEYMKNSPITKDLQQFFANNAEYWNNDQSQGAKAKRAYVGGATGLVDAVRRYKNEPQAALMAATENAPQIGMMLALRKAPPTAQATLGALGEAAMNGEDARQGVLEDARRKGADPASAIIAADEAAKRAAAASLLLAPIGAMAEVGALRRIGGQAPIQGAEHGLMQIPKLAGKEAFDEFGQESLAQVAQNKAIADNYDASVGLLDGAGVAGVHGAVAGGIMGAGTGAIMVPKSSDATPDADASPGTATPTSSPQDQQSAAMDELRAAAEQGQQPEQQEAQQQDMARPAPAQQEPASGLSGVVQRAQASTAPDLTTMVNEAIASGQTPDFSALAQASNRERSEVVDLFNRRRTLVELADTGDLNGMRDMAARMTADPQEQQSLIEQAVAVRDKRRVMASQPQPTQQAEPQQPATPIKTPRDTAYEKMLADAEASLASGASDVDTFLAVRKKYAGNKDLAETDINGVIDDAKASLSGKRDIAAKRESAIESAIPHLKAGDEVSAVTALADAGITDDAEVVAALKEASGRGKAKPAAQAKAETVQPKSPMQAATDAAMAAEAAGKGVKLATIAKKHGVSIAGLARSFVEAKRAAVNTRQPEDKPGQKPGVLALPAPQDAPVRADQPLVSRRGQVMPKAQAEGMNAQADAEKRDMRRAMSEEAGNPTGVPTGMRPRIEAPARAPQKAVLPDMILRTDGKPFASEQEATRVIKRKGAQDTHEIAPAPEGKPGVVVKRKKQATIDTEKDDILAAIAKAGGVNWEQARKQGGFDPAESGRRGSGILRVFKKNGGMTLDGMAETLSQYGYPVTDVDGNYTVNALLDAMDAAMRGSQIGTPQFNERLAREMHEQEAEWRALDDAFDGKTAGSAPPAWLDDGADALVESVIDGEAQPSAVMADALNEVENEREIASPAAGAGQKADAQAEAGSGQGGNAPAAGRREAGQQESQGGAGQDSGAPGFQLTAQTEAERLAEEQRQAADLEAKRKEEEKARLKAQADRELSSFTLTGSDRPADVAMAAGQNDLFWPKTRGEKEAENKAVAIRTPGTVKTIIRARNGGRVIDIVSEAHNGTMEDMLRIAKAQRRNAMRDHQDAGDGASITFAEENGAPKWRISLNGNTITEIGKDEAARIASEESNRDTGDKIESTINSVMTEVRSMGGDIIGVITDPYSGNRDEIMGIAQSQRSRMFDRYPDASNMQSTTIATDGSGRPAWRVRPNMSGIEQIGQQAKTVAPETAAIESKPDPVREMTEEGRAKDGKPIIGGDKFRTSSGRETTPYPHQKSEKYASQWLIDNATAEAEARGDDFNAPIFRRTTLLKNGRLTDADRDSMLMYLFGEQPKVVPSILKPLTEGGGKEQGDATQRKFAELSELSGRSTGAIRDAYNAKAEEDGKDAADLSIDQEILRLKLEKARKDTPANKKFDSLIATAADSPAKLQEHGIERVLDNAESRTELVRLRDYLTSLRPDKAEFIADAANDIGGDKGFDMSGVAPKPNKKQKANDQQKGEGESPQVSPNKVFTEDAAAKAREILRKALLGNKPMSGMDPELFQAGVTLAGYHIEKGARTFAAYAKAMLSDLGESVRPYLKSWYMGVKYDPRASEMSGMSTASEVDGFDVGSVSIAPAVGIDSLQDYVVSEIEKNIKSLFPDGNAPKSVLEVESTDYSIDLVLQNHPAVRGRRDDPRAYKDFADAAKGIDKGAIREKIIGQREIEPFKAWQPATLKEENREVQGNDQYSGGGQKGDSARHEPSTGQRVVLSEQRGTEPGDGFTVQATGGEVEGDGQGGAGVSGVRPAADGKRGDQQVRGEFGQFQPADGIAGSNGREGGADAGDTRVSVDRAGAQAVVQVAEAARSDSGGLSRPQKLKAQRDAESVEVIPGDKASVDASLPFLLEGQREDVLTAERRFAAPNGHGMLFTNGTGTGKTFLALGVIKRFAKQGKNNILVVVPNDAVIREWEKSAPDLGLTIHQLADTKDAGKGISITTYANFGQNDAIAKRDYDLVVMDEAHNLMQNAQADKTAALSTLRAITLHDQGLRTLTEMQNRPLVDKISALNQQMRDNLTAMKDAPAIKKLALEKANDKIQAELTETHAKLQAAYNANVTKAEKSARPKALFLSATPFAYEKNIAWAQGYLFDWNEGRPDESQTSRRYNEPDNYEAFMVQHFGYRMRYNRLTEPDAKVDRDLMQREFNSTLKKSGSLSARMLDVPSDYQRAFALTPNSIGTKIDEGMTWLRESNDGKFRPVYDLVVQKFDYLSRQRLLEAMKAEAAIPLIQKWHALGKKVVVFYDFNEGGGFSPFNLGRISEESMEGAEGGQQEIMELVQEFYDARPDLLAINTSDLASPLDALREAFPHAGVYNGQEAKKKRAAAMDAFNDDNNPDANVLIVQSSANAGWSAHDQTGKNKRVLINLGMPTAPTKAIQQEGRIYRQGQNPDSDSMFVYLNTGTSWERIAFANTIARRASTAENLAMGEQARGLRDAFIQAFEDSDTLEPSESEGKGGKEKDRALAKVASPFDRAKTYYYGQLKKTAATKAQEGNDYFATPEPLGMKMVEWLKLDGGERALEPSAGHGAISRWLPDNTENTVVEPSYNLLSRAALNTNAKQVNGRFEDLNLVNKFDGIVMNPPFGSGGRTAIDHLEKAFKHLSDGGRIVAIIPEGPSADQKFDRWYYGTDDKGKQLNPDAVLRAVINLPAVTFERAATTVRTRIVIIDKVKNEDVRKNVPSSRDIDLSQAGDINALFDRLEGLSAPARVPTTPEQAHAEAAPEPQQGALLELKNTTHAIKKIPLYVAKMTRRVSADSYASLNAVAKRFGGYYSRYEKNGAIPGFQFESEDSRQKFIDAIGDQGQYGAPPSSPTPGVAEVSETGEYITSIGGQNERDTSSVQSRKRAYGSHSAAAHDDLFAASTVPASESEAERNRTDFSKHFSTVSENLEQGRVKSPERITGHKEAAALFARWKDFSQERFLVAGLDANNKVVEVAVHTVGLKASASVDPGTVAGMVARNPSIKSVWLAHNHPSGSSAKSVADAQITRAISDLISAAGISVDGHIILGADSYTVLDSDGEALSRIPGMDELDYQAAPATASVPLVDRMITKRDPGTKITGPDSAKKYVVDRGASGIVLMDTQLSVVGFWEMTLEQMGQMRQNQDSTRSLMAAIDASNAFNAIVSVPDEMADGGTAWKNVAAMLAASQISVVDAIGYKTGKSYASRGLQVDQKGRNFYSAAAATSGPGLTTSRAREILSADPVLSKALPFIDIRNSKEGVPEGAEPFGEEGYYHNGRITLFADNIRATGSMSAEERLKWVAFHEITHRGVANLAESQSYLSELERAGKNPYVKNLAKKIYEARQELDEKYHVSMEVATEEALAEINAALRTGNVKQIKEQYGLHFPLSIRPRAKSAAARFIEAVKRIINRMFGRGLTDAQVENLLRKTHEAGMGPEGTNSSGRRNSFAGENSKTADMTALDKAKRRVAAGDNAEAVRKDTGWHTGLDGKWRFEIDDSKAYIKGKGSVLGKPMKSNADIASIIKANRYSPYRASAKLGSILHHPDLFRAYPDLANIDVWAEKKGSGSDGSFEPESGVLTVREDLSGSDALSVIHHEIQHAIQENEGFATGGRVSTSAMSSGNYDYLAYYRLAGEVESRNTEARANMTDAERRATSPKSTADVAEWDQIVTFAKGLAEMVSDKPTDANLSEAQRQLNEQLAIADRMIAEHGGLFAPNGQPSKLSRHQWAQVRTANFKRWFGDWEGDPGNAPSVVDDNGEPKIVYHSGDSGLTEIRKSGRFGGIFVLPTGSPRYRAQEYQFFLRGEVLSLDDMREKLDSLDDGGLSIYQSYLSGKEEATDDDVDSITDALTNGSDYPDVQRVWDILGAIDEADAQVEIQRLRGKVAAKLGYGAVQTPDEHGMDTIMVTDSKQIKSATGNAGTFSGKTDDIRYSPSPKDWITEQGRITKRVLSKEVAQRDLTLWQKTLGTQLNAALKNPAFKKVYDLTQRLIQHVNNDAYDSLNAAPDVLSRLEDWNDYKRDIANTVKEAGAALTMRQSKRRKDMAAAAEVLFEGTRFDKKVYSDKELDAFKLTADQKEIYRQARAAIDKSVGNAGKSQALNVAMNAEAINWETVERLVNMDLDPDVLFSEVSDLIGARIAVTKMDAENSTSEAEIKKLDKQVEKMVAALAAIGEIQAIVERSATEGYAPLMRWGKYTVAVIDPVDGKTLRFHMLESKREQAALELKLREKYGVANVVGGVLDEGKFEQFKGITPETVALFASVTGMDQDAAYQEYLKLAIPGRSALKRKIHRKGDMGEGIEGFSTDLPRVLSSFVLSNARKSARDLYRGPVYDAIEDIGAGGVAEKARELAKFVMEPDENDWSVGIRNMLFVWNMGASVAFGVLNLSQPWMMTLPWLSQFSDPAKAAGIMGRAAKLATAAQVSGKAPKGYEAEYSRAVREGIVDPQNVFMLQGVERGKSGVGSNIWRNVAHGMGLIASATESMNRKLTLIAALDVARAKGDAWLKSKGFADAYDFAARSVAETQGIYNKGNRPAWARNPALAVILVFKQYSINWVEMASRMASNHYGDDRYRKGFWMLVGALFMMAGGMGLPFADDLIDLIESGMSWAGKPVNVERQMQMALGKDLYEPLMNGPVNSLLFNPMGADMFGRMSMGNMIPATAVANPGLTWAARSDEAVQALGAGAGLASKFVDAYNQAASGNVGQALITASPRAVTSIAKAAEMTATGQYKDSKGRTVRSVTPAEALIKGLDLQPASVARIQRERGRRFKDEAIQAQARTEIRNTLIDAYESGDQDAIDAANNRLRTWNDENPLYPVHINRRALRKTVRERGKNWSARDEAAKGMEWMNDWIPESSK